MWNTGSEVHIVDTGSYDKGDLLECGNGTTILQRYGFLGPDNSQSQSCFHS